MDRPLLIAVPDVEDRVSPDEARRDWAERFAVLAHEGATAWWATDDERAAWGRAGRRVAQAAGLSHLQLARR